MRFRRFVANFALILGSCAGTALAAATPNTTAFLPAVRVGYTQGDQWEPALAADGNNHVYILYPQYGSLPHCPACTLPAMVLLVSGNNGATWERPRQIVATTSGQFDPQIVVDAADRSTVYAAWLQNGRRDVVVAKSSDFGQSWSVAVVARARGELDKPVLAARGVHVYVAFSREGRVTVASSHDGGNTFSTSAVKPGSREWAVAGGAVTDPGGSVFVAWTGYVNRDASRGRVHLYVSRSSDGGASWATSAMDSAGAPAGCAQQKCGWAYLGPQITLAADSAGALYALWNSGPKEHGTQRIYFSSSTTSGATWSAKSDVSLAAGSAQHAFPTVAAGAPGDVRIAWMDTRNAPQWNTYYRSSTNGGASWSQEAQVSSFRDGYSYIQPAGFSFPFGDYFGIAIDTRNLTQMVWGEGMNFQTPGSIWYASGR